MGSVTPQFFYIKFNFFFKIKTYKLWGVDIQQDRLILDK